MTRAAAPFGKRAALTLVVGGTAIFLLLLYAIGSGWDGGRDRDGGAHGAANGLNGYAALAALIEAQGASVSMSRSADGLETTDLLVLTPPHGADGATLRELLAERVYYGPTVLILPKYFAARLDPGEGKPGWVRLIGSEPPEWVGELGLAADISVETGQVPRWSMQAMSGALAGEGPAQFLRGSGLTPVVSGRDGEMLAAYAYTTPDEPDLWPIFIIAEPDLLNNQGLANNTTARLANEILAWAMEGEALGIVFDLTLPGLGQRPNLLTLAFQPPFLAATLCLLIAALVIGWRAFHRFGAADAAEADGAPPGKRLLAANGAALIERAGRAHLLGAPYAALLIARTAKNLGVTESSPEMREAEVIRIARARGLDDLNIEARLQALREARRGPELLRAAREARIIERTLVR